MKDKFRQMKYVVSLAILLLTCTMFFSCDKKEENQDSVINQEKDVDITEDILEEKLEDGTTDDLGQKKDNTSTDSTNNDETKEVTLKGTEYYKVYSETGELPNLSEVYQDYFKMGVALSSGDIINHSKSALVAGQFNSITCENEMKADFVLDRVATLSLGDEECPVINMSRAETALKFAQENQIQLRGHTLVWHSQTPKWLFTVGYDTAEDAPFVSREVMIARMENYIRQEIEFVNENYPGVVYAWDVLNEAIEVGDGHEKGYRTNNNLWYEVIGDDFAELAFTFARKYATEEQKLFYNDYGTYEKSKMYAIYALAEDLKSKNLIDGIGMQDHIQVSYPALLDYQFALNKYGELGLEIHITELDIDEKEGTEDSQSKLATRYKNIMSMLQNMVDKGSVNITSVTFWGLTDDRSWLNKPTEPSYPLLFDKELNPKAAYFGVLQDKDIKSY